MYEGEWRVVGGEGGEEGGGDSQIMSQKKRASPTRYATRTSEEELKYKSVQNHTSEQKYSV